MVYKPDEILLRLRDDCIAFNPSELEKMAAPSEDFRNVGIHIVYGLAREVRYQNLLGLNVLTIRI